MNDIRTIAIWLAREVTFLVARLREPGVWAVLACGLLLWPLAYQFDPPLTLSIGGDRATHRRGYDTPFLNGFNDSEPADRGDMYWWKQDGPVYRWASPEAEVVLPGVGGYAWVLIVSARSGRPDGSAVTSRWNTGLGDINLTIGPQARVYRIMGRAAAGDLHLSLTTEPFAAPGDSRALGLVTTRVQALPMGGGRVPAAGQLALLAATVALVYALLRRAGLAEYWSAVPAGAFAIVSAILLAIRPLDLTIFTPQLAILTGISYGLFVLLAPPVAVATRALGVSAGSGERGTALAIGIAGFGLRMGGMLHPYAIFSDLGLHINLLEAVIRGGVLVTTGLPCEAGAGRQPYPTGQYVTLAPGQLLLGTTRQQQAWLVQGGVALLESATAVLIWLVLRASGLGRRAALIGAALYVVAVPLLRSFSVGEMANLFAQGLLAPLLLFLALGNRAASQWRAAWIGSVALALLLLSHTGVTLSTLALLVAWLPLWWLAGSPVRRGPLLAGGAMALGAAFLLFYSAFGYLPDANRGAAQVLAAQGTICPPGYPLADKIVWTVALGVGASGSIAGLLPVAGLIGLVPIWRRGRSLALVLLACWIGTLLSFGTLLTSDQAVRWPHFLFPALCLGAGVGLAAWMRRGWAGYALALAGLAYVLWFGVDLWVRQIASYLH